MTARDSTYTAFQLGSDATFVSCDVASALLIADAVQATFPRSFIHVAEGGVLIRGVEAVPDDLIGEALRGDRTVDAEPPATRTVQVRYDGPDLPDVAQQCGMTVDEVISRHQAGRYEVLFCGFTPGMSYLAGLDPRLVLPRRETVRPLVPPGSLAIAAHYTAVYPSASPGGWHLIGSCSESLFDPHASPPVLLPPRTRVQFEAI